VEIPKDKILELIKQKAGGGQAEQAEKELPDTVDTDRDAGLLGKFGVDPKELLGGLGGGLGGKLGL
jgi:hypothetical protein